MKFEKEMDHLLRLNLCLGSHQIGAEKGPSRSQEVDICKLDLVERRIVHLIGIFNVHCEVQCRPVFMCLCTSSRDGADIYRVHDSKVPGMTSSTVTRGRCFVRVFVIEEQIQSVVSLFVRSSNPESRFVGGAYL